MKFLLAGLSKALPSGEQILYNLVVPVTQWRCVNFGKDKPRLSRARANSCRAKQTAKGSGNPHQRASSNTRRCRQRQTTVLTRRVAYLISQGVKPWSILAITFTNKAANELRSRIQSVLGPKAEGVWAMTFHATCARILRTEYPSIGKSGRFSIMDSQDQIRIMRQVLKEMNLSERQFTPSSMLRLISSAKDKLWSPQDMAKNAVSFFETKVSQAYALYQQRLSAVDAMDFDDLIMQAVMLLKNNRQVREKYQSKFQYILVDEYQDTNRAQYELTRILAASHKNLAVVGDDDQSIYNFRGADLRNILEFEKDYPSCKTVKLEENYRSTQVILDGAYHVVSRNYFRKDKRLWTSRKGGGLITVFAGQDQDDEAQFVAQEVLKLSSGRPLAQWLCYTVPTHNLRA